MPIRPIDFQSHLPRVSNQTRVQNEEQHRLTSDLQNQAAEGQHVAENQTRTVHDNEDTQETGLRDKKQGQKQNDKNKKNKGKNGKGPEQPNSGRTIDIRL